MTERWSIGLALPVGAKVRAAGRLTASGLPAASSTKQPNPPCRNGEDWVHEPKLDGYRLQVAKDGPAVRLFSRRGYDWGKRLLTVDPYLDGHGVVRLDGAKAHTVTRKSLLFDGAGRHGNRARWWRAIRTVDTISHCQISSRRGERSEASTDQDSGHAHLATLASRTRGRALKRSALFLDGASRRQARRLSHLAAPAMRYQVAFFFAI